MYDHNLRQLELQQPTNLMTNCVLDTVMSKADGSVLIVKLLGSFVEEYSEILNGLSSFQQEMTFQCLCNYRRLYFKVLLCSLRLLDRK